MERTPGRTHDSLKSSNNREPKPQDTKARNTAEAPKKDTKRHMLRGNGGDGTKEKTQKGFFYYRTFQSGSFRSEKLRSDAKIRADSQRMP